MYANPMPGIMNKIIPRKYRISQMKKYLNAAIITFVVLLWFLIASLPLRRSNHIKNYTKNKGKKSKP